MTWAPKPWAGPPMHNRRMVVGKVWVKKKTTRPFVSCELVPLSRGLPAHHSGRSLLPFGELLLGLVDEALTDDAEDGGEPADQSERFPAADQVA